MWEGGGAPQGGGAVKIWGCLNANGGEAPVVGLNSTTFYTTPPAGGPPPPPTFDLYCPG
jgi:hypothetical protein